MSQKWRSSAPVEVGSLVVTNYSFVCANSTPISNLNHKNIGLVGKPHVALGGQMGTKSCPQGMLTLAHQPPAPTLFWQCLCHGECNPNNTQTRTLRAVNFACGSVSGTPSCPERAQAHALAGGHCGISYPTVSNTNTRGGTLGG